MGCSNTPKPNSPISEGVPKGIYAERLALEWGYPLGHFDISFRTPFLLLSPFYLRVMGITVVSPKCGYTEAYE